MLSSGRKLFGMPHGRQFGQIRARGTLVPCGPPPAGSLLPGLKPFSRPSNARDAQEWLFLNIGSYFLSVSSAQFARNRQSKTTRPPTRKWACPPHPTERGHVPFCGPFGASSSVASCKTGQQRTEVQQAEGEEAGKKATAKARATIRARVALGVHLHGCLSVGRCSMMIRANGMSRKWNFPFPPLCLLPLPLALPLETLEEIER